MKRSSLLFPVLVYLLLVTVICAVSTGVCRAQAATSSRAECVLERTSRRILHATDAERALPMASTTKIVTALVILEDCDLAEEIVIPKQAEGVEGSSVYLKAGERYSVEALLHGLMLRSGNDCAVALALHHSGSVSAFARRMTERAALLGATNSNFVNPHGLPAEGHHTTARDLAILAAYAMENEDFARIVSCTHYAPCGWHNKNKFLYRYDGATGIKTGYTLQAGRCLVSSAQRAGMELVSVVLNSPQMYERTEELLDRCFSQYQLYELCAAGEYEGYQIRAAFSYPLTQEEREGVRYHTQLFEGAQPQGAPVGILKISLENRLLFSQNLYMIKQKGAGNAPERLCASINFWQNKASRREGVPTNSSRRGGSSSTERSPRRATT